MGLPLQLPPDASSTLYVEGIPKDASEREVAHIFRPFPGYQSLRIRHKESARGDGAQRAMCFVEFDNAYQASVAKIACGDYQIDRTDPQAGTLIVHYARGRRGTGGGGGGGGHMPPLHGDEHAWDRR
ncbi:hypothetical protein JKP88DRAFT_164370 [Tribonema minus]|uniref:RRM domain-containing protein n=1 Tax=Tribonema minus TaxID=303371 RepID=A0A835Z002_9STRA|nr:hypothetical protein JKP88DRAFT_164370 [Tribonema minus]